MSGPRLQRLKLDVGHHTLFRADFLATRVGGQMYPLREYTTAARG